MATIEKKGSAMLSKRTTGLIHKFNVSRVDGSDGPGKKHDGCDYFVLDVTHDPHAKPAIRAYADSCVAHYPVLAEELRAKVRPDQPTIDLPDKHPLRIRAEQAEAARDQLRSALAALIGADGREGLEQMEVVMRTMPAPAQDKAVSIDAIHALIATLPEAT